MPRFIRHSLISAVRCSAALLILTGAAAAQAQAQVETFYSSSLLGPTSTPDVLALPSFNTDLGTLQSVIVSLKFNICPTITVDNTTTAPISFTNAQISAPFSVSGPAGFTFSSTLSTTPLSATAPVGTSTYVPDVYWIYAVNWVHSPNFGSWEDQPGSVIDLAVTPGDLTTKTTAKSPGLLVGGNALEWENISVEYKYLSATAAPEPSGRALALIVGALMLAIMVGRRLQLRA